jgi:hypothetical protein
MAAILINIRPTIEMMIKWQIKLYADQHRNEIRKKERLLDFQFLSAPHI